MANTLSKLTTSGNYYTTGTLDEATFNPNSGYTKNLLNYSQNFSTGWIIGSITRNSTNNIAPDGLLTATQFSTDGINNNQQSIYQTTIAVTPLTTYTFSFYAKLGTLLSAEWLFAIYNETTLNFIAVDQLIGVTLSTNNWTRVTYTFTTQVNQTLLRVYPFRTSSLGTNVRSFYIWGVQLEKSSLATIYESTGINAIPLPGNTLSKLDSSGNYYTKGTIDEVTFNPIQTGYRKNLFDYSNFNPTFWTFSNGTITQNTNVAPDNTFTATTLTGSTSTVPFFGSSVVIVPGVTYTQSIYAKAGTQSRVMMLLYGVNFNNNGNNQSVTFDLSLGTVITASGSPQGYGIQSVGNGWYRIYITGTATRDASDNTQMIRFQDGIYVSGNYAYVWGPQIEVGSLPTIYSSTNIGRPSSNVLSKLDTAGNHYLSGTYDEVSGILPVTDGLVLYLDTSYPESYNGGILWKDMTIFKNDVTLLNSPKYSIFNGGYSYFNFNGTGSANNTSNTINGLATSANNFSISIWFKYNSVASYTSMFEKQTAIGGSVPRMDIGCSSTQFYWTTWYELTTVINDMVYNSTFSADTWYHTVLTCNGTTGKIGYLNGQQVVSVAAIASWPDNTKPLGIGGYLRKMNGSISVLQIYNRTLSATEVQQIFQTDRKRYGI